MGAGGSMLPSLYVCPVSEYRPGDAVSAGAACSSGKVGASHVLEAMGVDAGIARSAVRVSIGPTTTEEDLERFVAAWQAATGRPALAA